MKLYNARDSNDRSLVEKYALPLTRDNLDKCCSAVAGHKALFVGTYRVVPGKAKKRHLKKQEERKQEAWAAFYNELAGVNSDSDACVF